MLPEARWLSAATLPENKRGSTIQPGLPPGASVTLGASFPLGPQGKVVTAATHRFAGVAAALARHLGDFLAEEKLDVVFTSFQVSKGVRAPAHRDANNVGPSFILELGNYSGGGLLVWRDQEVHWITGKDRWATFDGRLPHATGPWEGGTRYSIIAYCYDVGRKYAPQERERRWRCWASACR